MYIPTNIALWMQQRLLGVNNEEWGIVYLASGASTAEHRLIDWQQAVDLVDRALVCDLIDVHFFMECHDRASLLDEIRKISPYARNGGFLWNGTQIHGTERLSALIEAHFPPSWDRSHLNSTFIEALEQVFADNGMPWSEEPLLPITPAGAENAPPV
jgi:hypothetical protein